MNIKQKFEPFMVKFILLCGVLISSIQYFFNRSLWLDESSLSLNIINKSFAELLQPLDYIQVAPALFLHIEKLLSLLIPNSEFGLRLFPLLCFWASIYIFYRILNLSFKNPYLVLFALSLFIFNPKIIYYSSEVKQYMCDIMFSLLFYFLLIKTYKNPINRIYLLGGIGLLSIYLSNIAPFLLFAVGLYFLIEYLQGKTLAIGTILMAFAAWGIGFLIYYFSFIHEHPSLTSQIFYFSDFDAFMPLNPLSKDFYRFFLSKYDMMFDRILPNIIIVPILFVVGLVYSLLKKNYKLLIYSLIPLTIHLLLSGLKMYPFSMRLILYSAPFIILIATIGLQLILDSIEKKWKIKYFNSVLLIVPLILCFLMYKKAFPIQHEEVKSCIEYIDKHKKQEDAVLCYIGSFRALKFYNTIGKTKIWPNSVIVRDNEINNHAFIVEYFASDSAISLNTLKNMPALKGRVWVLMSHYESHDRLDILDYFNANSKERMMFYKAEKASAFLYNFGN